MSHNIQQDPIVIRHGLSVMENLLYIICHKLTYLQLFLKTGCSPVLIRLEWSGSVAIWPIGRSFVLGTDREDVLKTFALCHASLFENALGRGLEFTIFADTTCMYIVNLVYSVSLILSPKDI